MSSTFSAATLFIYYR